MNNAGTIPVYESRLIRVHTTTHASRFARASNTTSLGRPLSARAMRSSSFWTTSAAIPRASSQAETVAGTGAPSGLNTIADGFGTLRDAHAGGREMIGGSG